MPTLTTLYYVSIALASFDLVFLGASSIVYSSNYFNSNLPSSQPPSLRAGNRLVAVSRTNQDNRTTAPHAPHSNYSSSLSSQPPLLSRRRVDDTNKTTVAATIAGSNREQKIHKEDRGITWIATFPNSGTTYTLTAVSTVSQRAHGYNDKRDETLVPIFSGQEENGPWAISNLPLPDTNPLIKTHCGGFAELDSLPSHVVMNSTTFLKKCLTTSIEQDGKLQHRFYSQDLVKKAVHLVRNPFDNCVARFNYERKSVTDALKNGMKAWDPKPHWKGEEQDNVYEKGPQGFKNWCMQADPKFSREKQLVYGQKA